MIYGILQDYLTPRYKIGYNSATNCSNFSMFVSFYREYNCLSNDILQDDLVIYLQGQGQFT